jgi:hypothetical protein
MSAAKIAPGAINFPLDIRQIPDGGSTDSSDDEAYDKTFKEKKMGEVVGLLKQNVSEFTRKRMEMREKIVKEILESVLPDAGEYDVDGMAPRQMNSKGLTISILKFLGCWRLNLHESILSGSMPHVQLAIKRIMTGKKANPLLINSYDEEGRTPLSLAVKAKREDFVTELLASNALPDLYDESTGRSPLMHSILEGTHSVSDMLLGAGADYNMSDFTCMTPLMLAASKNDVRHCQMLASKPRIDIDARDENGWAALHYAAFGNAPECCVLLLDEGSDRSLKDINKRKPIHIARFKNHGECVAALEDLKSRLAYAVGDVDN